MFAWPKNAVEIVTEIDNDFHMEWDTDSNIAILCQFIEEHCDPGTFRAFVRYCAEVDAKARGLSTAKLAKAKARKAGIA